MPIPGSPHSPVRGPDEQPASPEPAEHLLDQE